MRQKLTSLVAGLALVLASCGGGDTTPTGGGSSSSSGGSSGGGTSVYTPPAQVALTSGDVQQVLAQAVAQAQADGKPAVISVVDRVGNVLALFRMTGAPATTHLTDAPNGQNLDAQGLDVPAEAAAIAKAVTGAYLSSSGNAFSSRTASAISRSRAMREAATYRTSPKSRKQTRPSGHSR